MFQMETMAFLGAPNPINLETIMMCRMMPALHACLQKASLGFWNLKSEQVCLLYLILASFLLGSLFSNINCSCQQVQFL